LNKLKSRQKINSEHILRALDGVFGFSEEIFNSGRFKGTLLWFGLRTEINKLSEYICDANQVYHLMQAFINESKRSLIFLKTICSVQMFASTSGSCYDPNMQALCLGMQNPFCSVSVDNETGTLREERKTLLNEVTSIGRSLPLENKLWVNIICVQSDVMGDTCNTRWIIVNYMKGPGVSTRFQQLLRDDDICNPHLVGVAACIYDGSGDSSIQGHVFVYQPLPQEPSSVTGLPVHINAFFVLDQNRRHIRWPDTGNENQIDKKSEWNLKLLSELLPEAYTAVVMKVVDYCKEHANDKRLIEQLYHAIPNMNSVTERWVSLSKSTLELLWKKSILRSTAGKWIEPENAVYMKKSKVMNVPAVVWEHVASVFVEDKEELVEVSDHVTESFEKVFPNQLSYLTPSVLRNLLKAYNSYMSKDEKVKHSLYSFLTVDDDTDRLATLHLLPLQDSSFIAFDKSLQPVFKEDITVVNIFSHQPGRFVSLQLEASCSSKLDTIKATGWCMFRIFKLFILDIRFNDINILYTFVVLFYDKRYINIFLILKVQFFFALIITILIIFFVCTPSQGCTSSLLCASSMLGS